MATKYTNLHISVSKSDPKIIDDTRTLQFVGTANGENIVEIKNTFAVKVMDAIDDEIVKKAIEEAKAAGVNDVYLMDRDFVVNALQEAAVAKMLKSTRMPIQCYVEHQRKEIKDLKAELAKARGGCQRLRESKEELQECIQTLKKNFDEERDARIKRDKEYSQLFIEHEKLKNNEQHANVCRPCYVSGRKALFHGWFLETNYTAYGLIEFENGNLRKVSPYDIRFMDDKVRRVWEGKE